MSMITLVMMIFLSPNPFGAGSPSLFPPVFIEQEPPGDGPCDGEECEED